MYHQNYYKLICIDYQNKQIQVFIKKLIFLVKLEEDDGVKMLFVSEKQEKTILNFSLDSLIVREWYK